MKREEKKELQETIAKRLRDYGLDLMTVLTAKKNASAATEMLSGIKESNEQATAISIAEIDALTADLRSRTAYELLEALEKLQKDPHFGICISCDGEIDKTRLKAVPNTTHCRKCMRETRPIAGV